MTKEIEITRSHCNSCGSNNKHVVLTTRQVDIVEHIEDYGPVTWKNTYDLLECCGCETVSMRHTSLFEPTGETQVKIYPPPVTRRRPNWVHDLPTQIKLLMKQVYQALDANSRALALMGARTILDVLLVEASGDVGPFSVKLDKLEEKGFIGSNNRSVLNAALEAGNAASHRGFQPSVADTNAVMDIVENLLQAIYHLQNLADTLKRTTPKRT